jgi:hypothetical protein
MVHVELGALIFEFVKKLTFPYFCLNEKNIPKNILEKAFSFLLNPFFAGFGYKGLVQQELTGVKNGISQNHLYVIFKFKGNFLFE